MELFDSLDGNEGGAVVAVESEVFSIEDIEPNALTTTTPLDLLFAQYAALKKQILDIEQVIKGCSVMHYFTEGYSAQNRDRHMPSPDSLYESAHAIKALDAFYWSQAIALTGVLDVMPAVKRNEWHENIRAQKTPGFESETVLSTMRDLWLNKTRFFAEKVDGMFRALSGAHVTNSPEGFNKRMIVSRVTDEHGLTNYRQVEFIHDLRVVIAKFMGREEFLARDTETIIRRMNRDGKWHVLDGGALRMRSYLVGTAHLEVHPDVAWQLNKVLAFLYPAAIPSQFRKRPEKKSKREFELRHDVLSRRVCDQISSIIESNRYNRGVLRLLVIPRGAAWLKEVGAVFEAIGGVSEDAVSWSFDYDPRDVLFEVIASGLIPDHASHQYYPTPETLARELVAMAEVPAGASILEPSAGTGGIAKLLPSTLTTCVEISGLHAKVLESQGYKVINTDFLAWQADKLYDRIIANPPFSKGRAQTHVEHAATMLADGGRLVAIVPSSLRNRQLSLASGMKASWTDPKHGEFKNASVSVVILTIQKG